MINLVQWKILSLSSSTRAVFFRCFTILLGAVAGSPDIIMRTEVIIMLAALLHLPLSLAAQVPAPLLPDIQTFNKMPETWDYTKDALRDYFEHAATLSQVAASTAKVLGYPRVAVDVEELQMKQYTKLAAYFGDARNCNNTTPNGCGTLCTTDDNCKKDPNCKFCTLYVCAPF